MKHIKTFENFLNEGKELELGILRHGINARFEGIFEGLNNNDPVLIAMRAAREDRKKTLAVHKENLKKRVYGKQREKLEDELWQISQDLRDAYTERKDTYAEMDAEAGEKGNDWSDKDANRYGDMLNKIDSEIEKLLQKRQEIEIKLAY
jgi:hypothetical protein